MENSGKTARSITLSKVQNLKTKFEYEIVDHINAVFL